MSGHTVAAALDRAIGVEPTPASITADHGAGFMSRALEEWAFRRGVQLDVTRPGEPTDNSYIESFIGKLRDECLNVHQFADLADAHAHIEAWRCEYNEHRPRGSLGPLTPREFSLQRQEPRTAETTLLSA